MDKVLEKAKELRLAIEETSEYQEYIKNKEMLGIMKEQQHIYLLINLNALNVVAF